MRWEHTNAVTNEDAWGGAQQHVLRQKGYFVLDLLLQPEDPAISEAP